MAKAKNKRTSANKFIHVHKFLKWKVRNTKANFDVNMSMCLCVCARAHIFAHVSCGIKIIVARHVTNVSFIQNTTHFKQTFLEVCFVMCVMFLSSIARERVSKMITSKQTNHRKEYSDLIKLL